MNRFDYKTVGKRLRKAREYLGLTQMQVASIMGLGRDAILRIENGTRKIDAEELAKFSELYKVSIDEIVNCGKVACYKDAFVKEFERLSEQDKKEILNLIKMKNEYNSIGESK